jgi:hypothetical protein
MAYEHWSLPIQENSQEPGPQKLIHNFNKSQLS